MAAVAGRVRAGVARAVQRGWAVEAAHGATMWSEEEGKGDAAQGLSREALQGLAAEWRVPARYVDSFVDTIGQGQGRLGDGREVRGLMGGATASASVATRARFEEFCGARDAELRRAFERLDTDRDGYVSVEEVRRGVCGAAPRVTVRPCVVCSQSGRVITEGPAALGHAPKHVRARQVDRMLRAVLVDGGDRNSLPAWCGVSTESRDAILCASGACLCDPAGLSFLQTRSGVYEQGRMDWRDFREFLSLVPDRELLFDSYVDSSGLECFDTAGNVELEHLAGGQAAAHHVPASRHLVAGVLSGSVSRTAVAPLEQLRLRMMSGAQQLAPLPSPLSSSSSSSTAASALARGSGRRIAPAVAGRAAALGRRMAGLWAGNGVNVLKSAPQKGIDFVTFAVFKAAMSGAVDAAGRGLSGEAREQLHRLSILCAGALAGVTSCVALYPLEYVRCRVTHGLPIVDGDPASAGLGLRGSLRALRLSKGLRARHLYAGLAPSVAGIVPEAAITYGCFDIFKQLYARAAGIGEEDVSASAAMWCGVAAAFLGQTVSMPFEVIARRAQVGTGLPLAGPGAILHAVGHLARTEGPTGLFRGFVPATLKVIPMAAVSFYVYQAALEELGRRGSPQADEAEAPPQATGGRA